MPAIRPTSTAARLSALQTANSIAEVFHDLGQSSGYDREACIAAAVERLLPRNATDEQLEGLRATAGRIWDERFELRF